MEEILRYIHKNYDPLSIILYGSYANGTQGEHSDFDGLVLSKSRPACHDASFVQGVQLDLFVYPADHFEGAFDCGEVLQIFDGNVVFDPEGRGEALRRRVLDYIDRLPKKTAEELASSLAWCRKMLLRTRRGDPEGLFRWHWLLADSLEIFCDIAGQPYWGPKKSLLWMKSQHPAAYQAYARALADFTPSSLESWIGQLEAMYAKQ